MDIFALEFHPRNRIRLLHRSWRCRHQDCNAPHQDHTIESSTCKQAVTLTLAYLAIQDSGLMTRSNIQSPCWWSNYQHVYLMMRWYGYTCVVPAQHEPSEHSLPFAHVRASCLRNKEKSSGLLVLSDAFQTVGASICCAETMLKDMNRIRRRKLMIRALEETWYPCIAMILIADWAQRNERFTFYVRIL